MLQWMGGSRRKVTASRKSTQKRQQQFFEQRKRQQQQQEATAVESHNDSPVAHSHQKGNRSLDILSLLNVPKVAEDCRSPCGSDVRSMMTDRAPCARSFEAMLTKNHQISMRSPILLSNEAPATTDFVQPNGTETLNHQEEKVSSLSTKKNASTVINAESKCWGIDSSIQTSILDIICDDGPTNNLDGKPANEAHVAFSVEGLGDIGTETPKQSPQQPARVSCGDKSSFNKAAKKLHFHNNLKNMLDDLEMEEETKKPDYGYHLDSFLASENLLSPLSYTEHDLPTVKAGKHFDAKRWEMNSLHEDRDTNFWDAGSSFLEENIGSEKFGLDWKNGDANVWRNVSPDIGSKEPQLLPRSQEYITERCIDLDDGNCHFSSLEEPKRYSFMCDYKRRATHLSPYLDMEDRRDTLTSLREESCSSSAVRGRNTASTASERHIRRYGDDHPWQLNSNAKDNLYEVEYIMKGAIRHGDDCDRSRKYRRSNVGHSKSPYISQATVNDKFNLEHSWLPEEEFPNFPSGNTDTDPNAFIPGSWTSRNRDRERSPFGTDVQKDLPNSSRPRSKFETKTPTEFSPENISFFQPLCSGHSFNTSFSMGDSYRERNGGVPAKSPISADVADLFGDTETAFPAPEVSAQGSATKEVGDNLISKPEKVTHFSPQNLNISQESNAGETNTTENESSFCKEKLGIHQKNIITNSSEEDTEETSPPAMIQHELDDELDTKELQSTIPGLSHQNLKVSVADVGCSVAKPVKNENLKGCEGKIKFIQPSCQVMTVERYVLQLFCVSQGKAAMWDAAKRLS